MGAGDTSGVDSSYPSPFGSPYDLQSYNQPQQQHLHGGMVVSPDIGGGASGADATVMYDNGDIAYEVDQTGEDAAPAPTPAAVGDGDGYRRRRRRQQRRVL